MITSGRRKRAQADSIEPIDANSPVPLYAQLKRAITSQIESDELRPGDRLPSERILCETHGLARTTVRRAITELLDEGVLQRARGRSPVVASPRITVHPPVVILRSAGSNTASQAKPHFALPSSPFVGRNEELAQIVTLLSDPAVRMLTVLGAGGIGKTRLAMQAAANVANQFHDGAYAVHLSRLSENDDIVLAIAEDVGFGFHGADDPEEQLISYLSAKDMVLLLDNMEHLLDQTSILTSIIARAPRVKVLTTSRTRLNLPEEWAAEIQGMSIPAPGDTAIDTFDAVQLFLDRVRQHDPTFAIKKENREQIIEICTLTEGLPLGIELAAAACASGTCREIADAIRGDVRSLDGRSEPLEARHKTLATLFEHSLSAISPDEHATLRQLTVFQGGFTADAAIHIAQCSEATLHALAERSLVYVTAEGRFGIHTLLRQYTETTWTASQEEQESTRSRHAEYYIDLLTELRSHMESPTETEAVQVLRDDIENVRAAWIHAVTHDDLESIERAVYTLCAFYEALDLHIEAEEKFRVAASLLLAIDDGNELRTRLVAILLARQGATLLNLNAYDKALTVLRKSIEYADSINELENKAYALRIMGFVSYSQSAYDTAEEHYRQSMAIYRQLGSDSGVAGVLNGLGAVEERRANFEEAEKLLLEALRMQKEIGCGRAVSRSLMSLGLLRISIGDYDGAGQFLEEGLDVERREGSQHGVAHALHCLSIRARAQGHLPEARTLEQESLSIYQHLGSRWGVAWCLTHMAQISRIEGHYARSKANYRDALRMFREIGDHSGEACVLEHTGFVEFVSGNLQEAQEILLDGLQLSRQTDDRQSAASCLHHLARVSHRDGRHGDALWYAHESLELAMRVKAYPIVMQDLLAYAIITAEGGDRDLAMRLLTHVSRHPATERETYREAETLLRNLSRADPNQADHSEAYTTEELADMLLSRGPVA